MKKSMLKRAVIKALKASGGQALSKPDLIKALGIDISMKKELKLLLAGMEKGGELKRGPKGRFSLKEKAVKTATRTLSKTPQNLRKDEEAKGRGDELVGVLRQHPAGFAWFYPDLMDPANQSAELELDRSTRIKIGDNHKGVSLDGDRVLIQVTRTGVPEWQKKKDAARKRRGEKPHPGASRFDDIEGHVVKVVERREGPIIGVYFDRGRFKNVQPDDSEIPQMDITDAGDAQSGQKVAVELIKWTDSNQRPVGKIVEVIGWPGDPGVDIVSVIKRHGLQQEFPPEVLAEAKSCPKTLSAAELKRRWDCRDQMITTVDPADARDHDDACLVEKLENGDWLLSVHIADVSHFVKPKSSLDEEAQKRGNSTYLVDRVLPMLPKMLSNELCSLTPDDDSATKCCQITFSAEGTPKKAVFADAVIRSKARLSYEQAQEMIDGSGGGEIGDIMRRSWELASILRKKRFDNGALDMEFPETKVMCDEQGIPTDIVLTEHTASHQMIEEFMLAANEAVAKAIKNFKKPVIYRIHEDPDADRLMDFSETAQSHGYQPGDLTNRNHVQKLLDAAKGKPEEYAIKLGLLKSLKRASYSVEPLGHYGLNKVNYCHFTSPIRRYADLVVHRALQSLLVNKPDKPDKTDPQAELMNVCQHISTTERTSAEAEIETKRMKQMEYLQRLIDSGNPPVYTAVVTEVRKMGLFIECPSILQRGVIRREDLPRGRWRYDENRKVFIGAGQQVISMGDQLQVQVTRVDAEMGHVDFKALMD